MSSNGAPTPKSPNVSSDEYLIVPTRSASSRPHISFVLTVLTFVVGFSYPFGNPLA